jgi:hypothetical protein
MGSGKSLLTAGLGLDYRWPCKGGSKDTASEAIGLAQARTDSGCDPDGVVECMKSGCILEIF